ncbi:PP2C family serine/threonine-protein phosphatase [Streptomyces sp. NBC_00687]|uniref:PP2C family serine/threonine-protein phosphatase n=1 Tax=Streptomyces sp. NBC_00687 TaxID=2975807 RepID=UPI002253ABFE|nr:protein phosphatase 2C domain-containing protein [Streptomyces sp. NBC_00687]MCX4914763.1 protein phosphatase 2C domain-containing protein [Streptomyces sp. NBC_00687]
MMSQMPQPTALSRCPSCEEPLEAGDRFCGACGYDLSTAPAPPQDHPTIAINGAAAGAPAAAPAAPAAPPPPPAPSVDWPVAPEADTSDVPAPVHHAADIRGTDSGGSELPHPEHPHGDHPSGVRFDRPPEPDEYPLAPPAAGGVPAAPGAPAVPADPRTADLPAPPAGGRTCVACRSGQVDTDGYCENCGHAQPRERDHMEQELGAVAAVSDRGLRHHRNEDAFAISSTALPDGSPAVVAIVCDGVSSATRPDEASLAASRAASESLMAALPLGTHPQQALHEAIVAAAEAVNALADPSTAQGDHAPHVNAPACTIVGAVVTPALLIVGWVGDSRAYWVPVDRTSLPARLTEDDSWAAQMVAAGLMNEAEAYADERAHAITGWLGADAYELEPHTASFKPDRPGVVVVCTDGLWNYAEAAEDMAAAVPPDAAERPLHSAQVLVGHALDGGGHDNVTVAVLPFPAPVQGAGSA